MIALVALLFATLLCGIVTLRPFNNSPDIRSDGVGYHIWSHAIAHGDFTFCRYKPLLTTVTAISGETADGSRCKNKYPPGVGMLQLAFTWPFLADRPGEAGFSAGEHRAVLHLGAALLFSLTVLVVIVLMRRGLTAPVSVFAVAAFVFGTGLFHYATYDASFSHIYSAFGAALAMWLAYGKRQLSIGRLAAFALVAAWLYTVRQTNAALSLAVVYVAVRQASGDTRWRLPIAWLAGTGVAAVILLAYGFYASGEASLSSYGAEGFPTMGGHSLDVLLSYERGLFLYYPVFLPTLALAVWQWRRPSSQVFIGLVAAFALLYGSWYAWQLGAGFGHRGFVELAPFGMVVLADAMSNMPVWTKRISTVLIGLCAVATILAMAAYWRGDLPFSGAVAGQYWQSISPITLPGEAKFRYSEDDIRRVQLEVLDERPGAGGTLLVRLRVNNRNATESLHGATGGFPPLCLSWRIVRPDADVHKGWNERLVLPVLHPGESQTVTVAIPRSVDIDPGQQLQFSMVQEGVFWAHDIGVPPLSVPWFH
ncbi:MAG: hypothetical protein WBW32_17985 [Luteibacter sp.]